MFPRGNNSDTRRLDSGHQLPEQSRTFDQVKHVNLEMRRILLNN